MGIETESQSSVPLLPILTVNFVGALGFSIVLPFLIFLVTRLGGNALVYGIMGATYSFFQLIGAPILGRWSDRFGRRRVLLLSQIGTLASWGIFLVALFLPVTPLLEVNSRVVGAFTITLPLLILFLARALDGITGGNVSVANAYLADITPDEERSTNFGKMAMSSNLGFILGPALAAVLGVTTMGEIPPVIAALLISLVATVIIVGLPNPNPCTLKSSPESTSVRRVMGQDQKECYELGPAGGLSTAEVFRLPGVAPVLSLYFLVFLAFNLFYIAFPVWAVSGLEWTLLQTGVFFSVMGLAMVVVQGPVLKRVSRAFSDKVLVATGSGILAASFMFFTSPNIVLIYTGTLLLALGNGVMWPSIMAILSRTTDAGYQGAVQGVASSVGAVASITGLLVGGLLFAFLGANVFLISACLTAIVSLGSVWLVSRGTLATGT
jgi:MFS family permease